MRKALLKIFSSMAIIIVSIVSLASTMIPPTAPIFSTFTVIQRRLEELKKADPSTKQQIKNEIDLLLGNELQRDPNILTTSGPHGLTPAHYLLLQYFMLTRGLHFQGVDLWNGQSEAYKELFEYAFSKLLTPKAVTVQETGQHGFDMSYLKHSGITKKPMTAAELRDSFRISGTKPVPTQIPTHIALPLVKD